MIQREHRARIEAKRGVVRDQAGQIIRSQEWITDRKIFLCKRREMFTERLVNINAELEGWGVEFTWYKKLLWKLALKLLRYLNNG